VTKNFAVGALAILCACGAARAQLTGPSSSQSPYVLPTIPGVQTQSILTVGDTVGGYRMVGIPDGLGAFGNGDGTFTLMMNHELGAASGVTRAHGSTGSFVSRWSIDSATRAVGSGADHAQGNTSINLWNGSGFTAGTAQIARLCSADLAPVSAYSYNGLGTTNRIFMSGEENGTDGRAFAHVATGADANKSWQLPALGRFSWENAVANPYAQQKTIVIGTDDSTPGEVYAYVGNKTGTGSDVERAGLTNGNLFGIRVTGMPTEDRATGVSGRFDLYNHGDVTNRTGAQIQAADNANSVTKFLRPEDGAWDPRPGNESDFYFVTTDRYNTTGTEGHSRLYRMRFDDITNPEAGGEVTIMIDGYTAGPNMMDNICVDSHGRVLIQEDIGGQDALGKIWLYDIDSGGLALVAEHDAARFTPGAPGFLTRDEEASGIIDAKDILGDGWFLLDVQAHYGIPGELVEGGQLLAMYVNPGIVPAPASLALFGIGGLAASRRRRS
jgi:hypothetical protein